MKREDASKKIKVDCQYNSESEVNELKKKVLQWESVKRKRENLESDAERQRKESEKKFEEM